MQKFTIHVAHVEEDFYFTQELEGGVDGDGTTTKIEEAGKYTLQQATERVNESSLIYQDGAV